MAKQPFNTKQADDPLFLPVFNTKQADDPLPVYAKPDCTYCHNVPQQQSNFQKFTGGVNKIGGTLSNIGVIAGTAVGVWNGLQGKYISLSHKVWKQFVVIGLYYPRPANKG